MNHDEQWLIANTRNFDRWDFAIQTAKNYAEHLTRWRSVADGDLPEDGQEVDIIWSGMRQTDFTFRMHGDRGYFDSDDDQLGYALEVVTHWKPIELPEIER